MSYDNLSNKGSNKICMTVICGLYMAQLQWRAGAVISGCVREADQNKLLTISNHAFII